MPILALHNNYDLIVKCPFFNESVRTKYNRFLGQLHFFFIYNFYTIYKNTKQNRNIIRNSIFNIFLYNIDVPTNNENLTTSLLSYMIIW